MKTLLSTIALIICAFNMSAQTVQNDSITSDKVYLRYGIEPTTMISLGYQHNFSLGMKDRYLTTYGEWSSAVNSLGFKNSEIKIGGIIPVIQHKSFKIINNLGFSAGATSNKHFKSNKFAVSDEIAIGIYKKTWFIAGTVEYEKIYLNEIEHTEFYRETYYGEAKDGWYTGAGGMFQFGIEGGITISQVFDIHAEFKIPFTEKLNSYGGSPAHVNLGLGYRF